MSQNKAYFTTFRRVVLPTDFSEGSQAAFAHALKIALAIEGRLEIVHVDPHPAKVHWTEFPDVREVLVRWGLLAEGASPEDLGDLKIGIRKVKLGGRDPVPPILAELEAVPADLVVMATHQRHGMDRWLHREVAARITRLARTTALFVPLQVGGFVDPLSGQVRLDRAVLPVDDTLDPQPAVDAVGQLVGLLAAAPSSVTLLHVGSPGTVVTGLSVPESTDVTWEKAVREGEVIPEILAAASQSNADLIAVTTEGRHGFLDALRGSTTEQLLRDARCPVLAVPSS